MAPILWLDPQFGNDVNHWVEFSIQLSRGRTVIEFEFDTVGFLSLIACDEEFHGRAGEILVEICKKGSVLGQVVSFLFWLNGVALTLRLKARHSLRLDSTLLT